MSTSETMFTDDTDDRAVLYMVMMLAGWNDASQGPLLPSLQAIYNVDYLVSECSESSCCLSDP